MEAYIYDHVRTPRARGNKKGALNSVTATQLGVTLMDALNKRNELDCTKVEDLIMGCVTQIMDQGANVAKTIAQASGYGDHLAAYTLNRFCGSGLEAINQAAAYIKAGYTDLLIAGGVESMSRVKMGTDGGAIAMDPMVAMQGHFVPQGISADLIATKYGYSRNDVDQFAVVSQQRAHIAQKNKYFDRSIVPVKDINGFTILDKDENPRPETNLESLAQLNPSFEMIGKLGGFNAVAIDRYPEIEKIKHVHHPGNSSAIVDGASLTLIGNKEIGQQLGLQARARIRSVAITGTDPTIMLVGPAPASRKALKKAGMLSTDIDLYEVNEAFAAVPLRFMEDMNVDHGIVNVNGGSIALGHPLGATGSILVGTALDELERRDLQTALITLCIGGGMGIATIIERI